jgi:F-type H+-transporting ATPase subunit gamma
MLSRAARPALRAVGAAAARYVHQLPWAAKSLSCGAITNNARHSTGNLANAANYATLREIEGRLKSIRNIEKITKTMKIVASTKLNRAQRAMTESRAYGQTSNTVFEKAETKPLEREGKSLLVVCSSDKGLCGGIHSGMSRKARKIIAENPNIDLVIVGEKCKSQLSRSNPKNVVLSFAGIGKDIPTFADAQAVADQITLLPTDYASIQIMYNKFINATSYEPIKVEAYSAEAIANSRESL